MVKIEHVDEKGRKYEALSDGNGNVIVLGPPEGLVDDMKLPEPFATTLHNILYARHIFHYKDAQNRNNLIGALQEALNLDAQKLNEAFFKYQEEVRHD